MLANLGLFVKVRSRNREQFQLCIFSSFLNQHPGVRPGFLNMVVNVLQLLTKLHNLEVPLVQLPTCVIILNKALHFILKETIFVAVASDQKSR